MTLYTALLVFTSCAILPITCSVGIRSTCQPGRRGVLVLDGGIRGLRTNGPKAQVPVSLGSLLVRVLSGSCVRIISEWRSGDIILPSVRPVSSEASC
ncbi:hypothetical protein N9L68_00615 [bacterium]|nr:hypothetical protein [bacterium]